MTDRVLIALPDGRWLALSREVFAAALAEGSTLCAAPGVSAAPVRAEPLLDADALASELKIPATWIEQAAREGRIPSHDFGRWRRFRRSDVEAAVSQRAGNGS